MSKLVIKHIDTDPESLAIKAKIRQDLKEKFEDRLSPEQMEKFLMDFDIVSSEYRFSKKRE